MCGLLAEKVERDRELEEKAVDHHQVPNGHRPCVMGRGLAHTSNQ